jgi:hydroxyacylglutathione hydrolase
LASTSTLVVAPSGGCLSIDPALTAAGLTALAADITGAGLRLEAALSTHPHWDHVLWARDLGDVPGTRRPVGWFEDPRITVQWQRDAHA